MFFVIVNANLMIENIIQIRSRKMKNVDMSAKL